MQPVILLLSCLGSFLLGYILGKIGSPVQFMGGPEDSRFMKLTAQGQKQQRKKIQIDEAKFVTEVSTDELVALGDKELGVTSKSADDISAATSKLAQLKKMKG